MLSQTNIFSPTVSRLSAVFPNVTNSTIVSVEPRGDSSVPAHFVTYLKVLDCMEAEGHQMSKINAGKSLVVKD